MFLYHFLCVVSCWRFKWTFWEIISFTVINTTKIIPKIIIHFTITNHIYMILFLPLQVVQFDVIPIRHVSGWLVIISYRARARARARSTFQNIQNIHQMIKPFGSWQTQIHFKNHYDKWNLKNKQTNIENKKFFLSSLTFWNWKFQFIHLIAKVGLIHDGFLN